MAVPSNTSQRGGRGLTTDRWHAPHCSDYVHAEEGGGNHCGHGNASGLALHSIATQHIDGVLDRHERHGPDNGGPCVVPGSHLQGLRTTHQSTGDKHLNWSAEHLMRDREGKQWTENFYSFEIDDLGDDSIRKLEIPAGGGVFFTRMTIHGSFANLSPNRDRLAWAIHYVKDGTWIFRADVQNTVAVPELARTTDSEIQTDG